MIERDIIVIGWIVSALLAGSYQVLLIMDERRSLKALKNAGRNGAAQLVAKHDIRSDTICFIATLIILVTGVIAFIVVNRGEPPFSAVEQWALDQFWRVLGYGVMTCVILLFVSGWLRLRDRHRLLEVVAGKTDV